jgi:hypothetical protein
MQRRPSVSVFHGDIRPLLEQQSHHRLVPAPRRQVQRRPSTSVFHGDVRPLLEHNIRMECDLRAYLLSVVLWS